MEEKVINGRCFVCSHKNPVGLHIDFFYDEERKRSFSDFSVPDNYIGYDGIVHGGILSAIFDDTMFHAVAAEAQDIMTVNLNVTFLAPVCVGHKVHAEGWITGHKGRVYTAAAEITEGDKVLSRAEGKFALVCKDRIAGFR